MRSPLRLVLTGLLGLMMVGGAAVVGFGLYLWYGIASFNGILRETGGVEMSPMGALLGS